jgi:hypothetical protein
VIPRVVRGPAGELFGGRPGVGGVPWRGSWRGRSASVDGGGENTAVDLARIGWLVTVFACVIAVVILALDGYYGYAGVTFAVAVSAAINLT